MGVRIGFSAVVIAAATVVLCGVAAHAGNDGPADPSFLLFAGSDLWRDGQFLNGGTLWSPNGLNHDGFTFKLLLAGGLYDYPSSDLGTNVQGTALSVSALPGWRIVRDGLTVDLFAGAVVQDFRLSPNDPGSILRGSYAGGQFALDVWYQPDSKTMVALDGSISSIAYIGSARAAFGWRPTADSFFVGPESQALWCTDYLQLRFGAHVTAFRIERLDVSAGAGVAIESTFGRVGPYLRLGFDTRL